MRQKRGIFVEPLRVNLLERRGDRRVSGLPPIPQLGTVSDFLGQRMLERVFDLGIEGRGLKELRIDEVS